MNLFSEDPQFRRAQYQKLSDNVSEWQEEISRLVDESLPTDMNLDSVVRFQKVDNEKGYGVGSVVVRNSDSGTSIGIPVIIKAWHLAPLDLFFKDDKVFPLNEENLAKAFYHAGLGVGLAPRKPPPQLADDGSIDTRYPPMGGKYTYASVQGFVHGLRGTTAPEDVAHFKLAVQQTPSVLAKVARSGNLARFKKFASAVAEARDRTDKDDEVDKLRAIKTLTVKKDGPNEYRMYANSHDLFDPVLVDADRGSVEKFLHLQEARFSRNVADLMNDVDKNGETTVSLPESPYGKEVLLDEEPDAPKGKGFPHLSIDGGEQGHKHSPFVFDPKGDSRGVENAEKFGRYGVRDRDGVLIRGFVIPNVVSFDGGTVGEKIFLGASTAAFQGRIAGIPLNDEKNFELPGGVPETGQTGVLVFQDGKKAFSTAPFQVTNVSVFRGARGIGVMDYKGEKSNLIFSPLVDGIIKLDKSDKLSPLMGPGKNYMVSSKMTFVRMPRMSHVSDSSDAFLKKAQAEYLDSAKLTVSQANGRYIFRSNALSKYAGMNFDFNSLPRHEAAFLLASWGLGQNKIAMALDGLKDRICLEVHHLRWPDRYREKIATPAVSGFISEMKPPMTELVKVAALLEDADSVDMVLSLGFLNSENLARFSGAREMLQQTVNGLSKLLLAARLGLEDINEDAIKSALTHLERVLTGLRKVKMLSKSDSKTAADASSMRFLSAVAG